ncbi:uncharacterized protein with LGFP repeats [Microbacterium trichothecenolyticum]|uniref:hypothetical protein n=1 Tax=Microbacterium trichothecenolyticum TaxID=69370 RepID=UPI00285A000B|nr:hypothetical protein [Microbacterium trichothecenolyticum]MDR7112499.1 uncharacterized protein with LGFP repeats [Microbacterium trichothecenolyticum]
MTSLASPSTGIDNSLEPGATITGNAWDPRDLGPLEGLEIWLVDVDDPSGIPWASAMTDASGRFAFTEVPAGTYTYLVGSIYDPAPLFRRSFRVFTFNVASGETINISAPPVDLRNLSAGAPPAPTLSTGQINGEYTTVSWPPVTSEEPIVAYSLLSTGGWWADGHPVAVSGTTSTSMRTRRDSAVILASALTADAEGKAAALVINDPQDPEAPSLSMSGRTATSLTVTPDSMAPPGAVWWFGALERDAGVSRLRMEYPDALVGGSFTLEDVASDADVRIFTAWTDGVTMSQITMLEVPSAGPPVHPWFQARYAELGGVTGSLGAPLKGMECQSSSCWQEFAGGVLTSDGTQIVKLSTAYVTTWLSQGGPDGALGLVAGPEACFGTYCATPFTHGVITWTPNVGVVAIPVHAWFETKWKALGGLTGAIGAPVGAMQCQSSSCWQAFTGGVLTSDGQQIVKLSSAYVSTWLAWGGPNGDLGLVAGPEACFGSYCQTPFAGGVIVWVPGSGVFPVAKNWFYQPWVSRGGASGSLGLPADAMKCQSAACYQVFQNGTLTSSTSGIVALSSAYVSTWLGAGGPDGALGLISGPEVCFGTYCQVPFERGLMVWEPGVGVRILTGSELDAWLASHAPPTAP